MLEKIKNQIEKDKLDRESYKEYIEAFTSSDSIKEYFKNDDSFNNLVDKNEKDSNENEDDYF